MQPRPLDYATPNLAGIPQPVRSWISVPSILLMVGLVLYRDGAFDGPEPSTVSRRSAANTDLANLAWAVDAFASDVGRYPTTAEGLSGLLIAPPRTDYYWRGPYLKRPPVTDPWGNAYSYRHTSDGGAPGYELTSHGPDGKAGTADDLRLRWQEPDDKRF